MGQDILDYLTYPDNDEWTLICKQKADVFEGMIFDIDHKFNPLVDLRNGKYEFNHWKNEFNNRVFNLNTNYAFMMHFYKKGIPDEESFTNFKGADLVTHYWFSYHVESVYSRIFGLIDLFFHIANVKYQLNVPHKSGFNREVINKLYNFDKGLRFMLKKMLNNDIYRTNNRLRNDFTHNQMPTNLSSGAKTEEHDGKIKVTLSKGEYTSSNQIISNIDAMLDFLKDQFVDFNKRIHKQRKQPY